MKSFRVSDVRNVGLVWKIGALLLVTMLVIVAISIAGLYALTKQFAIQEAEGKIKDLLLQHQGLHTYISQHQKPAVYKLKEEDKLYDAYFSPELLSSSYMTRNIHKYYNNAREEAGLSELYYKLAANNPRNLINQADEFEEQLIQQFNADKSLQEYKSILTQDGKKYLYYALPFVVNSESCMRCHSTPEVAPKDLVDRYGGINGFGEEIGDIRAIISIRSPLSGEIEARNRVMFISLGVLLGGILLLFFVSVWLVIRSQVIKPLANGVHFAREITDGNIACTIPVARSQDEIGQLLSAMTQMSNMIRDVLKETENLISAVKAGSLAARGDTEAFSGAWRTLVVGINNVIDALVVPINVTADYIERFSKSDIPEKITTEYKGDFNTIKENLNLLGGDIRNVLTETTKLSQAIQAGKLDARCNPDAFGGGWRELALGINTLVDAFVTPITVTAAYLDRIAKGDIPDMITEEYQGDFNEIKQNMNRLIEAMHGITGLAEAMAGGNLNVEVEERSERDVLMQVLNMMLARLNDVVTSVTSAADTVASGSQGMHSSAEKMSQGATAQAASAEEASSSMEQMTATIRQNAENALRTEQIARHAAKSAEEGEHAMLEAVTAMQQIAKKISIVEEIARQTHVLSLNATIEAAKAEEKGKGFAVVAAEVRALAERSREAAEEITELAGYGVTITEKTGELLATLVPDIQKTAELVQEISAASHEQSSGAGQVNKAIQQLDQVTQHNSATSEELSATAEELASQAEMLQHTIAFFQTDTTGRETINDVGGNTR